MARYTLAERIDSRGGVEWIKRRRAEGYLYKEIARMLGCGNRVLWKYCRKHGIKSEGQGGRRTPGSWVKVNSKSADHQRPFKRVKPMPAEYYQRIIEQARRNEGN